jgi:purine-cytosine permease-like protein
MPDKNNKAKAWPLWVSIAATVFSVVLALLPILKLVTNTAWFTSVIGWALTPVLTFILFGYDYYLQNKATNSVNFVRRPDYGRALMIVAYLSIAICVVHVWRFASILSVVG